ncbi:hypothetical protein SERLA73DRAFT_64416 [Serpula lacrymans var. lacrymans S7.3]|uniref:Uncharacterized protein n=2 Tax=Serpula lacrymans var. lacrymans TaxID=341189 RepID=F8QEG6_SERL3|nr:hypothetical protein SERLA73DRAFT_64416 [Serpula lacrymans var. lacrymans S7.3]
MPTLGDEYSIWNRITTAAASVLTVNVNKAWTSKISTFSGEETPPGQESRLSRAMKAYHLEKARDPSDLPEWLFTEDERRLTSSSRFVGTQAPENTAIDRPASSPPRSTNLRDIYDQAAMSTPSRITESSTRRVQSDVGVVPSKATNRLKALRDEKRNALGIRSNVHFGEPDVEQPSSLKRGGGNSITESRGDSGIDVSYRPQRVARPGLPSRPRVY